MTRCTHWLRSLLSFVCVLFALMGDVGRFLFLCLLPSPALAAENLFLRTQLALYQERQTKQRCATNAIRISLVWLSRLCDWRQALVTVQPATLIRWHRQGFRLFWRWKSKPGRPALPKDLQDLIWRMAQENPTWGQERIANELLLKLGLHVSLRSVRKYMPAPRERHRKLSISSQRWSTFLCNHAHGIIACDFCVAVTATFRILYVFVVIDHASRRLLHVSVTAYPTAQRTFQQLREAIPADHTYRLLIHDRDAIFSKQVDQNAICERFIGSLRRECLDCMIPLGERHLSSIVKEWVAHYNAGRPHMSLGLGIPQPRPTLPVSRQAHRHRLPQHHRVQARPILGGLHHDYQLEAAA